VTEAEWQDSTDPDRMLRCLNGSASARRLRLFTCACFDAVASKSGPFCIEFDPRITQLVEFVRRLANGQATDKERSSALRSAAKWTRDLDWFAGATYAAVMKDAWASAIEVVRSFTRDLSSMGYESDEENIREYANDTFASTVRAYFCSLYLRRVNFNPAWRTSDVMLLAQGIYESKAFDRLPILADALQDAGCNNEELLSHCRDKELTPVRGYWVLDLVIGKT
jgi:hypothetical protein